MLNSRDDPTPDTGFSLLLLANLEPTPCPSTKLTIPDPQVDEGASIPEVKDSSAQQGVLPEPPKDLSIVLPELTEYLSQSSIESVMVSELDLRSCEPRDAPGVRYEKDCLIQVGDRDVEGTPVAVPTSVVVVVAICRFLLTVMLSTDQ